MDGKYEQLKDILLSFFLSLCFNTKKKSCEVK